MSLWMRILVAVGLFGAALFYAAPASAQATRTWVSGVGDDANPCSRTAPCKTFAGAISKTAAGGEINCLDPGGWGAVTITKSMTIDCSQFPGSILNAGTNGIIVNDSGAGTAVVVIRGLEINSASTSSPGINGIRFISGASLSVEDAVIRGNTSANGSGILFQPSGAAKLFMNNVVVSSNGSGTTGSGVEVAPTAGGSAKVMITNSHFTNNVNNGIRINTANGPVQAAIDNITVSAGGQGVVMLGTGSSGAAVLTNSTITGLTGTGILAAGTGATIRVGNTTVTGNATGVNPLASSTINTYGNNRVVGNTTDGSFTLPALAQQ